MKIKTALCAALVFAPALAFAGSCVSPTIIDPQTPNQTITGDTCSGGETGQWSFGGLSVPHRSEVYQFTYNNNASGPIQIGPAPIEVIILSGASCSGVEPVLISSEAATMDLSEANLVNGQNYYMVVTAENTQPTGTCGPFSLTYETLPVELQSFSID